jgi:23S rRNA pseudouridine1911/1915/1917 synthase
MEAVNAGDEEQEKPIYRQSNVAVILKSHDFVRFSFIPTPDFLPGTRGMAVNQGYTYRHVIQGPLPGESVNEYLARRFPHSSSAAWRQAIESGEISIDHRQPTAEEIVQPGKVLTWTRGGWTEVAVPLNFEVIHCDEQLLVVNKPSGLPTLPGGGFFEHTLLHQVHQRFPAARPLHRLGRGTSGLVLFALTSDAASLLSRNWPQVVKEYWAVAEGLAVESTRQITMPIGPVQHPRLGTIHAASPSGKAAQSFARVLARDEQHQRTLFAVRLGTGRPHQIRIHLASIGHPLAGDPIYAAGGLPRAHDPGLPGEGGYLLHAQRLQLVHPATAEPQEWIAAPPADFCQGFESAELSANA